MALQEFVLMGKVKFFHSALILPGVLCWYGSLTLNQDDVGSIPTPVALVLGGLTG